MENKPNTQQSQEQNNTIALQIGRIAALSLSGIVLCISHFFFFFYVCVCVSIVLRKQEAFVGLLLAEGGKTETFK